MCGAQATPSPGWELPGKAGDGAMLVVLGCLSGMWPVEMFCGLRSRGQRRVLLAVIRAPTCEQSPRPLKEAVSLAELTLPLGIYESPGCFSPVPGASFVRFCRAEGLAH